MYRSPGLNINLILRGIVCKRHKKDTYSEIAASSSNKSIALQFFSLEYKKVCSLFLIPISEFLCHIFYSFSTMKLQVYNI